MPLAHFEEAVEDDVEFLEVGRNSSAKDLFLTFATDIRTEAHSRTSFPELSTTKLRGSSVYILVIDFVLLSEISGVCTTGQRSGSRR